MQEPHTPRNGNLNEINIKWRRIKERWRRNTSSKLTWKPPTPPIRFGFVVRRHLRTWKPICQESDAHASHTDTTHTNDTQCMKTGNMVTVLSWMENGEKRETNKNIIECRNRIDVKKSLDCLHILRRHQFFSRSFYGVHATESCIFRR